MEAVLEKPKSKKQHKKSKQPSSIELGLVKDDNLVKNKERKSSEVHLKPEQSSTIELASEEKVASCDNFIKTENIKVPKVNSEELVKSSELVTHSSVSLPKESHKTENDVVLSSDSENIPEKNFDACFKPVVKTHENQVEKCSIDIAVKQDNVCSENTFVERNFLNVKQGVVKTQPLHLYPDLKHLHNCEKLHSILSSQILVKTSAEKFMHKTVLEANKCYDDFEKTVKDLDKHPLTDMIDQYQRAKKSSTNFRSRLKYLKSDLKRRKDSLWKSVKKEVTAKGKCDDGYGVNVKHTYTIKELDQDKFNEVIKTLKEIEELLLSDAFHSYLEEVMRLRIDHYVHELIENEDGDSKSFEKEGFPDEFLDKESIPLKKCISVLFNSQRQSVQDSRYLNTCQTWLKTLASKLIEKGSFDDILFVINHVIRCPSGIADWASELIQIPVNITETEASERFDSDFAHQILLALFLVLKPVPLRESFLKNIKDSPSCEPADKFAVLDSEGEEEEIFEMSKNFSDSDVLSLLNQIPVRSLYNNFLLDEKGDPEMLEIKTLSDGEILKLFAYSTAITDVLFSGLETYHSENFELFFETISNLIRHILFYISKYWTHHVCMNNHFKSEIQAVYDKLFFHIVYKIYNFEKIHVWKILPALPYDHISEKMLWNILWIFFSPRKTEEQIYSEKDVEIKIKDDCVQNALINHIKDLPVNDIYQLLNAIEKIIKSCNFIDKDFIKFSFYVIFKVTVLEPTLYEMLSNEGLIILQDIAESFPMLVSELLKNINENFDSIPDFQQCIKLFTKMNILNWIPEDSDMHIISSWLMLNLNDERKLLACLILKNMNWDYKEGNLFLPHDLHKRVAIIVAEAYVKFDADNRNEGLVSKGVKQILQFTSMGSQRKEEKFVHWAWNLLFSLKLHPLDRKHSPWAEIYDGSVEECNDSDFSNDFFQPLLSAYEKKHPCACYLMLVMSNEGCNLKGLFNGGLDCFASLVDSEQYMAAINSLYYILPFFVKSSDELLEKTDFIKALSNLITADLTVISNITRKTVIGAVLHKVASVIKYQIYQASECTVECAAPLLKLWIKILMKMMAPLGSNQSSNLKNSAEQIHFLLDVCVKISFLHDYTRDYILDLFSSYCKSLNVPKAQSSYFWNRIFYSNSSEYPILNKSIIPEYPWLAWTVLFSEIKQKNVEDLWFKVSREMMKNVNDSSTTSLKKISQTLKVDLEFLPIYRWALQAVGTPVSHPVSPLIWQQFFLYFFQKFSVPNSENFMSIGLKYFRNGQYEWLFKKIKKHLADAEGFYRNLCRTSEHDRTEASEGLKMEGNVPFYSSLAKLFHAFGLWIDNESLHGSGVCLSALEPKYCPEWLELVLNGDKRVWFVLISVPHLKDDIDQKIHSWSFSKKNSTEVVKPLPIKEESLPQQIIRHVKRYETTLPVTKTETVSVVAFERNEVPFSSKNEVVNVIERNQALIFDKAQYFCEQMKKLKQLNFNYINWIPQEYEVEDCEITESKVCHKSSDCSGAAYFRLKIQKCNKNVRISERIENNRADYVIVEDQIAKLPVKDLCISSLYIENCIRSLANKIKQANGSDAGFYKKMGIGLFYHQMKRIDQVIVSVAEYPPSRQFFSLIIESLGREFLDGDDAELVELAKSILNHPESGFLALPLFNPNKSSVGNFLSLYSTLTSSIGKHSANTLLALFSKIDLHQWLNEFSPSFDNGKMMFNDICNALLLCGYHPSSELLPVCDILRRHFGILLKYMFPDLFLPCVDFLLKGMEDESLCVDVYYEAFNCFGCPLFNDKTSIDDIEYALKKFAQNQQLPEDQKMFVSVAQLNLQQITYVSHLLYNHFMKKRYTANLYKTYAAFIKPLGIFLAIISHSLIALHLEEISSVNEPLCVSELWQTFHFPFWPWIHPIADSSGLHFPWTDNELTHTHYMFKIFMMSLKYFHEKVLDLPSEKSVLSCLWLFYVEAYVTPGYRHYSVAVCHGELLNLPWHEFHPCTQDIEGMCKVLQSNLHESKEFLSKISLKIPWSSVMQTMSLTKPPDYVGRVLATLGKLLIISQLDCAESDDNLDLNVFKELESLSWQYVSMNDIEALLNLAYSKLDPFLIIINWSSGCEFHVIQFLKLICCMIPNPGAEEYSNSKRILYLKNFISTVSACCSSKATQMTKLCHKLSDIVSTLLEEIKVIICHVASPDEQVKYALPLVKEVLVLLNGLPEGELGVAVLNSVTSWLSINKTSPLLLPCIKVSSQNLNSITYKTRLIECCISTRFRDETVDARETQIVWLLISSYFSLNSKTYEEFVIKCVQENAYLTLYCCILHKLPHSESVESKKLLLEQIYSWIKGSELSCDAEAKFILLWDKLLELSIKLVYERECEIVRNVLTAFCWTLENFAQDKSNSGFFAIIGLGQASSLSVNFRFLCRVMIAYLQYQVPANQPIRIEPTDMENPDSCSSASPSTISSAAKALENLKALQQKKLYSALQSQIDYAAKCVSDSKYTFLQSREILKYFAAVLYPKDSYLSVLDT